MAARLNRKSESTMRAVLALVLATSIAMPAHAHTSDTGAVLLDIFLDALTIAAIEQAASQPPPPRVEQRARDDEPAYRPYRARRPEAREGLLLSFGVGGGSMFVSYPSDGRTGAFDLDFRLGYGFSDRFQLFVDIDLGGAHYAYGEDIGNWAFTLRGQTVLIGDRAGNGLNLNAGIGTGGVTRSNGYYYQDVSSPSGLALAGGISYDARISPWFALSPEFFVTWHAIPNGAGRPQDVASLYGIRLNFLWYIH